MSHSRPIPLVAVTADVRDADGYRWHAAAETYVKAVTIGLGGLPVVVPSLGDALDIEALLERVDGVLVTGSRSNVHPPLYGAEADAASEPYDHARDATTLPLIRAALRHGVPLLAICRGFQELNVALGGTLISEVQELPGRHDHRAPVSDVQAERFAIRQDVVITTGGCLGRIVEDAQARQFFAHPNHPYTHGLLAEIPDLKQRRRVYAPVKGEIPSPAAPPPGCHFHPRCPVAFDRCRIEWPALREIAPGHRSACHLNDAPGGERRAPTGEIA